MRTIDLKVYTNPEYMIILRRDDEHGTPKYSPIASVMKSYEAIEILRLLYTSRGGKRLKISSEYTDNIGKDLEWLDIIICVRTEGVSDICNYEHDCWIVDGDKRPLNVAKPKVYRNRIGWLWSWEHTDAEADDLLEMACDYLPEKIIALAMCSAARTVISDSKFLDAVESWAKSKTHDVGMKVRDAAFGGGLGSVERSIYSAITETNFKKIKSSEAIREVVRYSQSGKNSLILPFEDYTENMKWLSHAIRDVISLKRIMYACSSEGVE